TENILFSFEQIIAFVSKYITLKKGDLIFTGTPEGVGQVHQGDRLEAWLEGEQLLNFEIK
ncbi:MAG: 2-hydroxyhepta-2,4-diene-1,7-dioate isomerase, partial [Pedobacter sp.]